MNRRLWLQDVLTLSLASLAGSLPLRVLAHTVSSPLDAFMLLSQALTGKPALDRMVGARLLAARQKSTPALSQDLPRLTSSLPSGTLDAACKALALKILEAWYLGIVDHEVVTYEQALMFSIVADTQIIRSYCPNQPGFWASKPVENLAAIENLTARPS